jgi:uncharacterized protein (TIGR02145 family)
MLLGVGYSQCDANGDGDLDVLDVVIEVDCILTDCWEEPVCEGVEDIDGNCYETIHIGTQNWMAENLKTTKYKDGSEIPNITNNVDWGGLSTGAYGDYGNTETYGRLYNWYTVDDERGVCPEGWHVPSDAEYTILTDYLGGESVAGGKMKECTEGSCPESEFWDSPNTAATNESGFTGLPAGYRHNLDGTYGNLGTFGYFWSSSEYDSIDAWFRTLWYSNLVASRFYNSKQYGSSIRCLGD